MLGSLFDIVKDVATVVVAPVEMVLDVVSVPVKIAAEAASELVKDVKNIKN